MLPLVLLLWLPFGVDGVVWFGGVGDGEEEDLVGAVLEDEDEAEGVGEGDTSVIVILSLL